MTDYTRQMDILPLSALIYPVTLIGLGGIGSHVAYTVRKMGFNNLTLWDGDTVEAHNNPSQHFEAGDIGQTKAEATARQLRGALDEPCNVRPYGRFGNLCDDKLEGIIVSGVDSMSSRQIIWAGVEKQRPFIPLYIDGRVGIDWDEEKGRVVGEWIEVFTIVPAKIDDCELYAQHLYSDEEAAPLRCTAQAVAYIGPLITGFICSHLKKWITKTPYHRYILYDCLTNQILIATV